MEAVFKEHSPHLIKFLEIIGATTGIAGALLMSFLPEMAFISWTVWLISSLCLFLFAALSGLRYLMVLQFVFAFINVTGIFNTANDFLKLTVI